MFRFGSKIKFLKINTQKRSNNQKKINLQNKLKKEKRVGDLTHEVSLCEG